MPNVDQNIHICKTEHATSRHLTDDVTQLKQVVELELNGTSTYHVTTPP